MRGERRPRLAIVGAGPAGAFTASELRRQGNRFAIDFFDRLPTPWGLLRGGVAPDHWEIKRLARRFESETFERGARFFGNVEVGRDLAHGELAALYDAVVYATGAQTNRGLAIPGEELAGSLAATSLVGWYNGHPDFSDLEPDLSHPTVVVVGHGNVAADIARILVRDVYELARTDISESALRALRFSKVRKVIVLGRRGPAQAAFTSVELRHLGALSGVDVAVPDVELDEISQEWLAEEGTFTTRRNVELFREFAARPAPEPGNRCIEFRFLSSPVAVHGSDRVEAVEVRSNRLVRDADGTIRAVARGDETEMIPCGLLLRSVGYRAVPVPDVPFDEPTSVIRNDAGRVVDSRGERVPGVYVVGWIKRGPTGILGTNKRDAEETVTNVVADLDAGRLPPRPRPGADLETVLRGRTEVVSHAGWRKIDSTERAHGVGARRPRIKLETYEHLLAAGTT